MFIVATPSGRTVFLALIVAACGLIATQPASTQAPAPAWAGWARCQIDVQGPGYVERQIHTWATTGGAPAVEGAFRVHPATWSVTGGGSLQRTQGTQTLVAQWAINGASAGAPLAVFVRASDGRLLIQARHAQLRSAGAVAGYQQQIIDGKPQTPGQLSSEAFEWAFPLIDAPAADTSVSGSSTPGVNGSVGFMQPGGSRATAACAWTFGQGTAAPAPPPALASVPVPAPPAPTTAATPPAGAPPAGAPPAGAPPAAASPAPAAPPPLTAVLLPPGIPTVTLTPPPTATATTTPSSRTTTSPPAATATTTPSARTTTSPPSATATTTPPRATTTSPGAPPATTATPATGTIAGRVPTLDRFMAFTTSGTFTVPAGITSFVVEVWGAGAGGANGAWSTCSVPGLRCEDGAAGRGGGSGAYTRVAMSAPIGTVLNVNIGAAGAAGTRGIYTPSTDPTDGGATRVMRGGETIAMANGGRIDGTGGAAWSAPPATSRPGNDGKVPDGGAAVAGSVTPVGTSGGRGGNGGYHLCAGIGPVLPCSQPGYPGAEGLPGYALITW
jgi:hypothetical protein